MIGRLQFWLQGWPDRPRSNAAIRLGNAISTARYWTWRALTREGRESP